MSKTTRSRRPIQKPKESSKLRTVSQQEIVDMLCSANPDFALIPEREMWPMALAALGHTTSQISKDCGLPGDQVERAADKYLDTISKIPDVVRIEATTKLLMDAASPIAAVCRDMEKVDKLTPPEALKTLKELPKVCSDFRKLSKEMREDEAHTNTMNWDSFRERLGDGKNK